MPLNPKAKKLLDLSATSPPISTVPVEAMREGATSQMAAWSRMGLVSVSVAAVEDRVIPAPDLQGLPPALVVTAEYDVLRDEGGRYVERLLEAGVPARLSRYDGLHHRFAEMLGIFDQAAQARDEMCAWLREVLVESGPSTASPGEGATTTQQPEGDCLIRRNGT